MVGALGIQLRADLGFGLGQLGILASAFFAASALGSTVLGRLAQRLGAARSLRTGALTTAAAMLAIAGLARSWEALVALVVVCGFANAFIQPAANLALAQGVSERRRGLAFGIKQSAIPLAGLLSGAAVPLFGVLIGWRWAFTTVAVAALASAAATRLIGPPAPPPQGGRAVTSSPTSTGRQLVLIAIAGGLASGAANAMGAFIVDAGVQGGLSVSAAGALLSFGSVVGLTSRTGAGWLIDRRGGSGLRMVTGLMAGGALGMATLAAGVVIGSSPLLVVGVAIGFGAGWGWPGLYHYGVVQLRPHAAAAATGSVQTGVFIGGLIGPAVFGWAVETSSYAVAWAGAGVALVGAAITMAIAVPPRWLGRRARTR